MVENEGRKDDKDKLDWTLLPIEPLEDVVRVLEFGAKKYARDNWRKVDNAHRRYIAAALRHIVAYQKGEVNDPESGQPHLAHAACCLLFLGALDHDRPDDRLCGSCGNAQPISTSGAEDRVFCPVHQGTIAKDSYCGKWRPVLAMAEPS